MKRFLFTLGLLLFLVTAVLPIKAQENGLGEQNVVLSCLEPENTELDLTGGELNDYTTSLYDKAGIFKEENGPVYVLISYPVPGFKPKDSKFADTCEHRHNRNEEGQYWFCANLESGGSQCTSEMLSPNTEILRPEDAPQEPSDPEEGPCLKTIFQISGAEFNDQGQFRVESAKMYTLLHNNVTFWGLQFTEGGESTTSVATEETTQPATQTASLTLATFTGVNNSSTGLPTGANANCTTISWDPYGRVIDSLTLEPIRDVLVSLKNLNSKNVLEITKNSANPTFRNPLSTNSQGGFNFAVIPGTYYLYPTHPDFIFPIADKNVYNQAVDNLRLFDPLQEYIEINKPNSRLYQDSEEPIVEFAGASQRRDIIMQPKNPNYQGSPVSLISVSNARQGIKQLIKGIVSHPKSIISAYVNDIEVGQVAADYKGNFELYLNEDLVPNTASSFRVTAQKVPLVKIATASPETSPVPKNDAFSFKLIPAVLSGFVFNQNYELIQNAKVELIASNLLGFAYTTTQTNEHGFISLPYQSLPPTEFYLKVYPPNQEPFKLTIDQFLKLNTVYLEESGINLFNPKIATENLINPNKEIISKVKSATASKLTGKSVFDTPTPTTAPENKPQPTASFLNLFFGLVVLIILTLVFVVVFKKFKKIPPPENEPPSPSF
jgi:hypothetical protein